MAGVITVTGRLATTVMTKVTCPQGICHRLAHVASGTPTDQPATSRPLAIAATCNAASRRVLS